MELVEHAEKEGLAPIALAQRVQEVADRLAPLGDPKVTDLAETLLLRALALREPVEGVDRFEHLALLEKLSELYFGAGRWERAEAIDRRCLAIKVERLGARSPEVAATERNLGLSLFNQGQFREGESLLRKAVATLEASADTPPLELAYAVNDLADTLRAQNRYGEATPLFERSVTIAEGAVGASSSELVTLLNNLGGLYRDTNRYGESLWRLGQAARIAEASADVTPSERMSLWNNLAELKRYQGDLVEAERLYQLAIESARQTLGEDHPKLATYRNQLGELFSGSGRFAEAEALFETALAARSRTLGAEHLDVAYTLKCLGQLFARSGRRAESEDALGRALAIQERRLGGGHPEVAAALVALASALAADPNRSSDARSLVDRALSIFDNSPADPRTQADAYSLRADMEWRDHHRDRARADLARALGILERLRPEVGGSEHTRAQAFVHTLGTFRRMVGWEVDAGHVDAAFNYAERTKGRALLDQLVLARVDLRNGIEPTERARLEAKETQIRSRLAEHRSRLQRAREVGANATVDELNRLVAVESGEFQDVYEEIKNASRFWRAFRPDDGETITLDRVQRELVPAGGRMLFYVVGDEGSFVFDVPPRPQKASVHSLVVSAVAAAALGVEPGRLDAARLGFALTEGAGGGILEELSSPPRPGQRRLRLESKLHALWDVLVPSSLRVALRHSREVVVIPDGLLHQIPFEVLVWEPVAPATATRFWLDSGPPVRYAASATTLAHLTRHDRAGRAAPLTDVKVVSVSDPVFGGSGSMLPALERLPGTARESEAIRQAFAPLRAPRVEVQILQRADARESLVRQALPRARYIHLATHGLVDENQRDILATLALSPAPGGGDSADDGQLQLYEIYGLDLHSEVAVLSTCESRAGMVVPGEGVFALSRAFLAAGSKRVLASLWSAEDDSTADIVSRFFAAAAAAEKAHAHSDHALALFRAKQAARARLEWADPFFWGPFVLEGAR